MKIITLDVVIFINLILITGLDIVYSVSQEYYKCLILDSMDDKKAIHDACIALKVVYYLQNFNIVLDVEMEKSFPIPPFSLKLLHHHVVAMVLLCTLVAIVTTQNAYFLSL